MTDSTVTFRGYSRAALQAAFDKVANPDDWKDSICAMVPAEVLDLVCAAIEFFTSTVPSVIVVDFACNKFVVVAAGYRLGPAGDH